MFTRGGNMQRFNELSSKLNNVDEAKRGFILSLLKDFCVIEEQLEKLRKYPTYIINPHNPRQQKKLPVHEMVKDLQAQKNDIAVKILRSLDKEHTDESPLLKALAEFNK